MLPVQLSHAAFTLDLNTNSNPPGPPENLAEKFTQPPKPALLTASLNRLRHQVWLPQPQKNRAPNSELCFGKIKELPISDVCGARKAPQDYLVERKKLQAQLLLHPAERYQSENVRLGCCRREELQGSHSEL